MKTYLINRKTGEYYEKKETMLENISFWFTLRWSLIKDKYYELENIIKRITHYHPRQVIKQALNGRNIDCCYLYELEYAKLKEMLTAQERKYDNCLKWADKEPDSKEEILRPFERNIRHIKLAISLLEIITEKRDLYDYVYEKGDEEGMLFYEVDNGPETKKKTYTIKFNGIYKCLVNVNLQNANRFGKLNNEYFKYMLEKSQHEIYKLKAIHCYNLLREYFMEEWWI